LLFERIAGRPHENVLKNLDGVALFQHELADGNDAINTKLIGSDAVLNGVVRT